MDLEEKQFELGGVVFGTNCPVEVTSDGWSPGTASMSNQDTQLPGEDGVRFGKDYRGSGVWQFKLYTNAADEEGAWNALRPLANAWDAEDVRTVSGAIIPLRYRVAGVTRRVYGRPRRWTITPDNQSLSGRIDIVADFTVSDGLFYDDEFQTHMVDIAPPLEPDAGLSVPFIAPFTTSAGASARQTDVLIGGEVQTPISVKFIAGDGTLSDASLTTSLWTAALREPVPFDDEITLDTTPSVRAATNKAGASARLNPRLTRLSKMWLPPGRHDIVFTGTDPTGTAQALVSWRNAHRTPR